MHAQKKEEGIWASRPVFAKSVESISHRLDLDLRLAHCVYNAWWRVPRRKHALSILCKNPSTLSTRPCVT